MKTGDVVENAVWITGDEPQGMCEQYKKDVVASIDDLCQEMGFYHSPVSFIEKRPEEADVPEVPDHIQGQRVRLLLGSATVMGKVPETIEGSFVANLDQKDLGRLREITRKAHAKAYGTIIGYKKCDEIIEALGPDAAIATLRTETIH